MPDSVCAMTSMSLCASHSVGAIMAPFVPSERVAKISAPGSLAARATQAVVGRSSCGAGGLASQTW